MGYKTTIYAIFRMLLHCYWLDMCWLTFLKPIVITL